LSNHRSLTYKYSPQRAVKAATTEDKTDNAKDKFYMEVERVFDMSYKHHMKILLGDFDAKVGREVMNEWSCNFATPPSIYDVELDFSKCQSYIDI
jgi:hypothetical protein